MYSKIAEEEDNKMIERWQKDSEGIIIFVRNIYFRYVPYGCAYQLGALQTGLFSAVVAAVVVVSVQDLRPNSQDTSAFYLEKMYQLQADPNASRPAITSPLANPPAFSPPRHAIWVNSLWFLSLAISLTCAMLATLLQQWARRYVRTTQMLRCSPEKRARMRAYFANGVDKFHVSWAVETLPTLVHLSLLMFFAGLLVFLFNINHTVFRIIVCWVALTSVAYMCITLMPIFWHDSPYYAPLSSTILSIYAAIPFAVFTLLKRVGIRRELGVEFYMRYAIPCGQYRDLLFGGIEKAAEETASMRSLEIDGRVLEWTVDALNEDDELEKFLGFIPGFYKTYIARNLQDSLPPAVHEKISKAAGQFLVRTLSFSLIPDSVTNRRFVTCLNAAHVVGEFSLVADVLQIVAEVQVDWQRVPQSVEIGRFLRDWVSSNYGENTLEVQCIIAAIIASIQERDSRWMTLTQDQLGVPEQVLRYYLTHGESVLLANLNHIIRQLLRSDSHWAPLDAMRLLSQIDVHGALPELQHDFCTLWNEVVEECRKTRGRRTKPLVILSSTRKIYIALHEGTEAPPAVFSTSIDSFDNILWQPSLYPLCSNPNHLSDSVPPAHNSGTGVASHALIITHTTGLHDDLTPVPITQSPIAGTDIPPIPTSNQGSATPNPTDDPSLGNIPPAMTTSSHLDLQVPSSVKPATSPDQGIPMATQDAGRRALTHLSGNSTSTISGPRNADYHATSPGPSTPPDASISSPLLLPPPGHTAPVDLRSSTADSASLSDQNRPCLGIRSPNSATTPVIDPQEAPNSGPPVTLGKIDDPKN